MMMFLVLSVISISPAGWSSSGMVGALGSRGAPGWEGGATTPGPTRSMVLQTAVPGVEAPVSASVVFHV